MANEPIWEISLTTWAKDSRVVVNGQDVTSSIKSVRVEQHAGGTPTVDLTLIGTSAVVKVQAAIEKVGLHVPTADVTPLGTEWEEKKALP